MAQTIIRFITPPRAKHCCREYLWQSEHTQTAARFEKLERHSAFARPGQAANRLFHVTHVADFVAPNNCRAAVEPELEVPWCLQALLCHELEYLDCRISVVTVATKGVVLRNHTTEEIGIDDVVPGTVMGDLENVHVEPAATSQPAGFLESFDEMIPPAVTGQQD